MKKLVILDVSKEFESFHNKLKQSKEELCISFNLKEKDLHKGTGDKIVTLLNEFKNKKIKFKIAKPLPKCLFSIAKLRLAEQTGAPKNCFDCEYLFRLEGDTIKSCEAINKNGPKIYYMNEREQIWEFFNTLRLEKKPSEKCKKCLYFRRKMCDGLCFRL